MVYDLVIIGSGPGGYVGAIRAAQLGLKVAIIEKDKTFGGTCLNVGCIPSKALLDSSEYFAQAQHDFEGHGIMVGKVEIDVKKMIDRKAKIVKDLTGGLVYLFKKNKIDSYTGYGKIVSPTKVEIAGSEGTQVIEAKNICIATGSVPVELPHLKYDGKKIISSTEALELQKVPKHLIVVGGGVIGLELGSVWKRLGAKVTVIEFNNKIAGTMDNQITQVLTKSLVKQGLEFLLECKVTASRIEKNEVVLTYENQKDKSTQEIRGDLVLVSVGRKPFSDKLGLEELGIEKDKRGFIPVDAHYRTKVSNIFAIGDVIPGPMLAHKAEEEGVAVAEILAGQAGHVNYATVPWVIYTWPELAGVGLTEEQVKESGVEYKVGTFPFTPNARAKAMGTTDGLAKVIADKKTDKILGVHIVGPRASDMIAEAVMAMEFSASAEDMARTFHAHPTVSEVLREAALNVDKLARQM